MINLFTYGSLMCNDIMFAVAGCRTSSRNVILNDFYRSKMRNEEYPGITPRTGTQVDGVLYFDLSDEAIRRLDVFEGEYYDRQDVQVYSEDLGMIDAMTYVVKARYSHLLTGVEWSFAQFLNTGKPKFVDAYLGFKDLKKMV